MEPADKLATRRHKRHKPERQRLGFVSAEYAEHAEGEPEEGISHEEAQEAPKAVLGPWRFPGAWNLEFGASPSSPRLISPVLVVTL